MHSIDSSTPQSGLDSIVVLDLGAVIIFRGKHVNAFPACLSLLDIPHSSSVVEPIHTLTKIERAPFEEFVVGHRGKSIDCRLGFDGNRAVHPDLARAWRQLLCHLFALACDTPGIFASRDIRLQYASILMELLLRLAVTGEPPKLDFGIEATLAASKSAIQASPKSHSHSARHDDIWIAASV